MTTWSSVSQRPPRNSCVVIHAKVEAVTRCLRGEAAVATSVPDAALQWGHVHEPNCLHTVLNHLQRIPGFENAANPYIHERGLLTFGGGDRLLPVGASPDGILEVELPGQPGKLKALLEFKCPMCGPARRTQEQTAVRVQIRSGPRSCPPTITPRCSWA